MHKQLSITNKNYFKAKQPSNYIHKLNELNLNSNYILVISLVTLSFLFGLAYMNTTNCYNVIDCDIAFSKKKNTMNELSTIVLDQLNFTSICLANNLGTILYHS
jgi:hypothetical protein